jgi:FtsP/CotA-like multicopper oxidase with cupredoxin domain
VNPWDLNEPDPTDNGTMGTIPGAVIECNVGDKVIVHFRNQDTRSGKALKARTHSLHPHVFAPTSDGAYPALAAGPKPGRRS